MYIPQNQKVISSKNFPCESGPSYLEDAGVPADKAPYATLGIGATMVTMAIVTIPLMDRLGRRALHLGGLLGMVFFGVALTVLQVVSNGRNEETVAILGCDSVLP